MTDLSDFMPKILQRLPNVAEPAAFDALREAAREFCQRTRSWRVDLSCEADTNPIAVVPFSDTPNDNELTLPEGAELVDLDILFFDGIKVDPKTAQWLDEKYPAWRTDDAENGVPRYVTQLAMNEFQLVPGFEEGDVKAYVWLKPTTSCAEFPDFLFGHHYETIAMGAIGILMALPNQPFTNPDLAMYYSGRFEQAIGSVSAKQWKGQQRAALRVKPNYF